MKTKYFQDTDTLYIELRAATVTETSDVDENTLLDLDENGKVCGITTNMRLTESIYPTFHLSGWQLEVM